MILHILHKKISVRPAAQWVLACLLFFTASLSAHASKVVVTVTGIVGGGGGDGYQMFGVGKNLQGQPFTLVFTFDDEAGKKTQNDGCPDSASSISGTHSAFPATAVLTIGTGSFTFGNYPDSHWMLQRQVRSDCSPNVIGFVFSEGHYPQGNVVDLRIVPADGKPPVSESQDWHTPLLPTEFSSDERYGAFSISRPHDFSTFTSGSLIVKTVKIE